MADRGSEFGFFQSIHIRVATRIDISISINHQISHLWPPNLAISDLWLWQSATYDHQIWPAGTSTRSDSNETNQAGAGDVITSRLCGKLKTYLHYHSTYDHQTWQGVSYLDELLSIKSYDTLIMWSFAITWQTKIIISPPTTTVPMATKLGKMAVYLNGLLPIKSYDPLIMWSCEITWPSKALCLHYDSAYGHQTWQAGDLPWGAFTHVTLPVSDVVLQDHMTN